MSERIAMPKVLESVPFSVQIASILTVQEIPFTTALMGALDNPPEEGADVNVVFNYGVDCVVTATKGQRTWLYRGRRLWSIISEEKA